MIDPTIKKIQDIRKAKDPEVGVIYWILSLDMGQIPDPVGAVMDELQR